MSITLNYDGIIEEHDESTYEARIVDLCLAGHTVVVDDDVYLPLDRAALAAKLGEDVLAWELKSAAESGYNWFAYLIENAHGEIDEVIEAYNLHNSR